IGFKTKTTLLEPKVGWINRKQWFAAYAGPSFGNHQVESSTNLGVEPATKHTVGCWGGAEATLRGKRQGLFFCRFFAEYHYVPKLHWASDTVSAQNNGQSYSSQFTGAEVDLSFFTAGIGAGLSF
ncbi:MAG: hypothetical protein ABIQ93_00395, partial [Saprospiraceae bacterium]